MNLNSLQMVKKDYLNTDKGITKQVDLSALLDGGGGSELPEYSISNAGQILVVNGDGSILKMYLNIRTIK